MNNLYNKIYKAINEGIQKALLIDPDQNDVSINYTYHKINNSIYSKKDFNSAANEFIEKPNIDNYNKVLKYSMHGLHQYKVKNFNELSDIFNKIQNITNDIDLSWIDITNAITFITVNNELALNNIDNKEDIILIKFDNIENLNHPIIIHKDLLFVNEQWSIKMEKIKQKRNKYTDGYENIKNIESEIINLDDYPAFKYCINLKNNLKLINYEGYLPAIGELKFLSENTNLINYILKYVNGTILNIDSGNWWSSTQYSVNISWNLCRGSAIFNYFKDTYLLVLPLFHKK